ncbi:MAG TPA: ATP-binding protein, partial [Candidatus Wirthbacteria bacterium]|nr:ATP-binding protein [Candidatus Wirthbacteria bacterium]
GLGLYVCKSFIEIYNGKVWFKSIEDKGSSFYFSLPVIDSHMLQPEKTKKRTKLINNSLRLPSPLL